MLTILTEFDRSVSLEMEPHKSKEDAFMDSRYISPVPVLPDGSSQGLPETAPIEQGRRTLPQYKLSEDSLSLFSRLTKDGTVPSPTSHSISHLSPRSSGDTSAPWLNRLSVPQGKILERHVELEIFKRPVVLLACKNDDDALHVVDLPSQIVCTDSDMLKDLFMRHTNDPITLSDVPYRGFKVYVDWVLARATMGDQPIQSLAGEEADSLVGEETSQWLAIYNDERDFFCCPGCDYRLTSSGEFRLADSADLHVLRDCRHCPQCTKGCYIEHRFVSRIRTDLLPQISAHKPDELLFAAYCFGRAYKLVGFCNHVITTWVNQDNERNSIPSWTLVRNVFQTIRKKDDALCRYLVDVHAQYWKPKAHDADMRMDEFRLVSRSFRNAYLLAITDISWCPPPYQLDVCDYHIHANPGDELACRNERRLITKRQQWSHAQSQYKLEQPACKSEASDGAEERWSCEVDVGENETSVGESGDTEGELPGVEGVVVGRGDLATALETNQVQPAETGALATAQAVVARVCTPLLPDITDESTPPITLDDSFSFGGHEIPPLERPITPTTVYLNFQSTGSDKVVFKRGIVDSHGNAITPPIESPQKKSILSRGKEKIASFRYKNRTPTKTKSILDIFHQPHEKTALLSNYSSRTSPLQRTKSPTPRPFTMSPSQVTTLKSAPVRNETRELAPITNMMEIPTRIPRGFVRGEEISRAGKSDNERKMEQAPGQLSKQKSETPIAAQSTAFSSSIDVAQPLEAAEVKSVTSEEQVVDLSPMSVADQGLYSSWLKNQETCSTSVAGQEVCSSPPENQDPCLERLASSGNVDPCPARPASLASLEKDDICSTCPNEQDPFSTGLEKQDVSPICSEHQLPAMGIHQADPTNEDVLPTYIEAQNMPLICCEDHALAMGILRAKPRRYAIDFGVLSPDESVMPCSAVSIISPQCNSISARDGDVQDEAALTLKSVLKELQKHDSILGQEGVAEDEISLYAKSMSEEIEEHDSISAGKEDTEHGTVLSPMPPPSRNVSIASAL